MLSEKMEDALNAQMNWEIYSAHIYLSMSSHFAQEGLGGFAQWMYAPVPGRNVPCHEVLQLHQRGGRPRQDRATIEAPAHA